MKNIATELYILQKHEIEMTEGKKPRKNQLCFAIMLKHFQLEGHHPRSTKYIDPLLVSSLSQQLGINSQHLEYFNWEGKSTERYRKEIRCFFDYRVAKLSDIKNMKAWLNKEIFTKGSKRYSHLAHAYCYFKKHRVEAPRTQDAYLHQIDQRIA